MNNKKVSFFRDIKLRNKIMLLYGILFLIPIIIASIIIFQIVSNRLIKNMEYATKQGYEQSLYFLEYKLYRIIKLSDTVITNMTVEDILTKEEKDYTIHEQLLDFHNLRSYLQTLEDEGDVYRVKIYVPDSYIYSNDGSILFGLEEADNSQWYKAKQNRIVYFSPGQYLDSEHSDFIALVRNINRLNQYDRRIGVLRIDISQNSIIDILKKTNPTNHSVTYLVNSDNTIVASSDMTLLKNYMGEGEIPYNLGYMEGEGGEGSSLQKGTLNNESIYFIKNKVVQTDWTMVTVIPTTDFFADITFARKFITVIVLLMVIIVFYVGYLLISTVVKRIDKLIIGMNLVKKGDFSIRIENNNNDEIGILIENFNDMIHKINVLLIEKYNMEIELKNAELKALYSQINPHFLYNTLEMINWLGYGNRPEEIQSVVVSLSKYYRLTLNHGKEMLRVEDELKHTEYYLIIESKRFKGKIVYDIDVPVELNDYIIPKITLQPLIENALLHGIFEKKDKRGRICIHGKDEGESFTLFVIDDGVGMSDKTLSSLLDENRSNNIGGYGIHNVDKRLRLKFGDEYGLSFESVRGVGTTAIIKIPKYRM